MKYSRYVYDQIFPQLMVQDNVIFAKPLFNVISYVEWCHDSFQKKKITVEELNVFMQKAPDILNGAIKLKWKSGVPFLEDKITGR